MKKILIIGLTILCALCTTGPAYSDPTTETAAAAQNIIPGDEPETAATSEEDENENAPETDPYTGEVIEWSDDVADGECSEDVTYAAEGLQPPTMSASEAAISESIVASMQETAVQYDTSSVGTVQIVCQVPSDFPGYTVESLIFDDNYKKVATIDCYEKNNYVGMVNLPAGHYYVSSTYVPNDKTGKYPFVTDCREFTLSGSEQKVITASMAMNTKGTITPSDVNEDDTRVPVTISKRSNVKSILVLGGVVLTGAAIFFFIRNFFMRKRFE